jgi:heterodisulfide reductase subunit A-like polyferredoxin
MNAIHIQNKKAYHTSVCRGCGRCASTCPNRAVDIRITDPAFLKKTVDKFLSIAKID